MKYIVHATPYLFNILINGENFENVIDQQLLMAKYGIPLNESEHLIDIERELIIAKLIKAEKDKIEFEKNKFEAYAKILGFTPSQTA